MTTIESITLGVADPSAAQRFYDAVFGLDDRVRLQSSEAPTTGFRGFTLSLITAQPADAAALHAAAVAAGATSLKPAEKSIWGFGGVVQAPDGTIWQIATQKKKDSGPASRSFEEIVLLLGVEDVKATKRFYVDRGLAVGRSFGSKYVEFEGSSSAVKLALYKRRGLAKVAGVDPEGMGSHRIAVSSDAGPFTDPDGFAWEAASSTADSA